MNDKDRAWVIRDFIAEREARIRALNAQARAAGKKVRALQLELAALESHTESTEETTAKETSYTVEIDVIGSAPRANLALKRGDVRLTVHKSDGACQVVVIPGTDELDGYQVWFPSEAEAQKRPSGINLCTGGHYT